MVDFSTKATDVQTQIQPDTKVVQPVDRSGEINALNTIGNGITGAAKTVATIFKNDATTKQNKFLADLSVNLNNLQSAAQQGLSAQEVRTRGRLQLTQALSANPNAQEDILKTYSTWLSQSGVDKIQTPEVQAAQIDQAQKEAAVKSGFLSANDTQNPDKVKAGIASLEDFQQETTKLDTITKQTQAASAKLDLTDKEKKAVQADKVQQINDQLAVVAQKALPYWRTQYDNIQAAADKATDPLEKQKIISDGITQLDTDFAQRTSAISGSATAVGQEKLNQILQPQKDLLDVYKKRLTGDIDTDTFTKMSDGAMARSKALAVTGLSERGRQMIAYSDLAKAAGPILATQLTSEIADTMAKNDASGAQQGDSSAAGVGATSSSPAKPADLIGGDDEDVKNTKNYLTNVQSIIKDRNNKGGYKDNPKAEQQLQNQINGILKGVDVYGNATSSAKEFQPIIDFFANPDVGAYLKEKGGIPPALQGRVGQVLQDGYQTQVIPLVSEELQNSMSKTVNGKMGQIKAGDVLQPSMDSGRFAFTLKPGVQPDSMNSLLMQSVNNSNAVKVLNKMIISNAHIGGNTDYKKSYETIAPYLFPDANGDTKQEPVNKTQAEPSKLSDLVASANPDVVQEVLDARKNDGNRIETANSRGYEPDINGLRPEFADSVKILQADFGKNIPVVSGFRDPERNAAAGGAKHSQHMNGDAVDIDVSDLGRSDRVKLISLARAQGFTGVGVYPNSLHLDKGPVRAWGPSYHKDSLPQWAAAALSGETDTASK